MAERQGDNVFCVLVALLVLAELQVEKLLKPTSASLMKRKHPLETIAGVKFLR
jgi:hypothetical protein